MFLPTTSSARRAKACICVVLSLGLLTAASPSTPAKTAAKTATSAFGPKEQPLGRPYADWLSRWGTWAFGGPSATNPLLHLDQCNSWVQPEPDRVFFLGAGGPGKAATTCKVPTGVAIAVTPGGLFSWDKPENVQRIMTEIAGFANSVRKPKLVIDAKTVDVTKYLVETPLLTTEIQAEEFGPNLGTVSFKSKGWMLVLRALPDGQHKIVISDELAKLDDKGQPILVKGKRAWDLAQVTFTLDVGGAPVAAAPPTTTTPTAAPPTTTPPTTVATSSTTVAVATTVPVTTAAAVIPEKGFNGQKVALPAGMYRQRVGASIITLNIPAGWSTYQSIARSLLFTDNDNLSIVDNPPVQTDASAQPPTPIQFTTFPADFAGYLRGYPEVNVISTTSVTVGGVAAQRVEFEVKTRLPNAKGVLFYMHSPLPTGSLAFELGVETGPTASNEVVYIVPQANGTPLVIDAYVNKSKSVDEYVNKVVQSITPA
jgi:hypothetical protein